MSLRDRSAHLDFATALSQVVRSHIPQEVPWGLLLSGGIDFSVVAARALPLADKRRREGGRIIRKPVLRRLFGADLPEAGVFPRQRLPR